jgi:PhnB protein
MPVKPIPEGFHSITPYLVVDKASELIDFMKKAFGAEEVFRMDAPGGRVGHAEIKIGDSMLMISDMTPEHKAMQCGLYLYVPNVDEVHKKAVSAGATSVMEPADQFYGDRSSGVKDPQGNVWWIGTHQEDVPPEELKKRAETAMKQKAKV